MAHTCASRDYGKILALLSSWREGKARATKKEREGGGGESEKEREKEPAFFVRKRGCYVTGMRAGFACIQVNLMEPDDYNSIMTPATYLSRSNFRRVFFSLFCFRKKCRTDLLAMLLLVSDVLSRDSRKRVSPGVSRFSISRFFPPAGYESIFLSRITLRPQTMHIC